MLRFEVFFRPVLVNALYRAKPIRVKGKMRPVVYKVAPAENYQQAVIDAALEAADVDGWDLAYDGPAKITIVDWRPNATGGDWDGIPKALQDSLQPQILKNDRQVWDGRVIIAVDKDNPRVVVTVEQTTREQIHAEALAWSGLP